MIASNLFLLYVFIEERRLEIHIADGLPFRDAECVLDRQLILIDAEELRVLDGRGYLEQE